MLRTRSTTKTVLLCIGDTNSTRHYDLDGTPFLPSSSARDLGLTLRNDLRTLDHVKKVSRAANCRQEIDELERVQKRFTRAVFWRMTKSNPPTADTIPTYAKRCEQLHLDTLELRRQRFDLLAAYRHLNKEPPFEDNQLLQLRPRTARLGPSLL
ncbi:hypothetical protein AAVH_26214 [Aphelenchoides avenae]|nr:hypothetical protein AAVH_26214 [Aphelenchus avenae]